MKAPSRGFCFLWSDSGSLATMRIRILGSATSGGFPQWYCSCRTCDRVRKRTIRAVVLRK